LCDFFRYLQVHQTARRKIFGPETQSQAEQE